MTKLARNLMARTVTTRGLRNGLLGLSLLFSAAAHGAVAGSPDISISPSPNGENSVVFTLSIIDRAGRSRCGVELAFGDGRTADVELDSATGKPTSIEHSYAKPMIAAITVKPKAIQGFWRSVDSCSHFTHVVRWLPIDPASLEKAGAFDNGDLDIVVLAAMPKNRGQDSRFIANIDGSLRLRDPLMPVCRNTLFLNGVREELLRRQEFDEATLDTIASLSSLGSLYEQLGIPFVGPVLDTKIIDLTTALGGQSSPCPSVLTGDLIAVPKFAIELLRAARSTQSRDDLQDSRIAITVPFRELKELSASLAKKVDAQRSYTAKLIASYETLSQQPSDSLIGTLFVNPNLTSRSTSSSPLSYCSLSSEGAAFAAAAGHRSRGAGLLPPELREQFDSNLRGRTEAKLGMPASGSDRKVFDLVFDDLNGVFVTITENRGGVLKCPVFVGPAEKVVELKTALESAGIKSAYGELTDVGLAKTLWAKQVGLDSWDALDLKWSIDANRDQMRQLLAFGINSKVAYDKIAAELQAVGYSKSAELRSVLQYLADSRDGKARGVTAVEQRAFRAEQERADEERRQIARRAERERYLQEFPFEAIISCGPRTSSHSSVIICFAPSEGGIATKLELRQGGEYGLFGATDLQRLGREEAGVGLIIPLRSSFELKAENSSNMFVLTVRIRDSRDGNELFVKSVDRFGTIEISR